MIISNPKITKAFIKTAQSFISTTTNQNSPNKKIGNKNCEKYSLEKTGEKSLRVSDQN
jgi:hypothetical protein